MPEPLPRTRGIIAAVALLSMSSGFVDAVVYTLHGHVFAYAMTGNLVLLGVAVSAHSVDDVARHVVPLAGFAAGVLLGKFLLHSRRAISLPFTLALQMAVFALFGWFADNIPSPVIVAVLAASGAVLITTIRRVGDIPFNITFMTGNLRAVTEGVFDAVWPRTDDVEARGARQARLVALACAGFLAGAAAGAITSQRVGNHSFWVADVLLLPAGWLLRDANAAPDVV